MWVPHTEREIAEAAAQGLVESDIFDAKAEIPAKPLDLATDVAAMATGGGVLLSESAKMRQVDRPF